MYFAFGYLQRVAGAQIGPKVQISGLSHSPKKSYFSKIIQTLFLSAKMLPLLHFSEKFNYTGVSKDPKLSQK